MKGLINTIWNSKWWLLFLIAVITGINFLASSFHYRFDLTKEKRYTLSTATKQLLKNLDQPVSIEVFLKGDFPAGFKKLANSVDEFLQECKEISGKKLIVKFSDPLKNLDDSATARYLDSIGYYFNIQAYTLQAPGKVGDELSIKRILPGAIINYKDTSIGVNFLKGAKSYGTEPDQLAALYNDVEATLEYKFASAIQKITSSKKPLIGYALGHGEAWGYDANDAVRTLIKDYRFDTVNIKTYPYIPSEFDALVILKPTLPFSENDKLKLDQYQMRGGKILWLIDYMYDGFDSLYKKEGFISYDRGLNLEDILFRYGVRMNQALLQDMQCDKLPQVSGQAGQTQQQRLVDWPVFPILNGTNNPISKNLDGVRAMFPGTLDTVKVDGLKKTILLVSSANAKTIKPPEKISFDFLQIAPDIKLFTESNIPVAVLLEGKFKSLFANRISKSLMDTLAAYNIPFRSESDANGKMIVVSDGDIALNQVSQYNGPLPMGENLFTHITYANHDFYSNCIEYLVNSSGILETRAKDYTLRLLDPKKVKEEKTIWQIINTGLPVLFIILCGFIYQLLRKRKYAV